MNLLERSVLNIEHEVQEYGTKKYDEGYEDGLRDGESRSNQTEYDRSYQAGMIEEREEAETSEKQMIEYMLDKLNEAEIRSLSRDQIVQELESELCRHMPVTGPTLFDK